MQFTDNSLTEIEVFGLQSDYNLADGHSYLDGFQFFPEAVSNLTASWEMAASMSVPDMEQFFKWTFASFYGLKGLILHEEFSICPTASNSIDIVGAWAHATGRRVGLVEPTFDNLALLLRRRDVDVVAVPEALLLENSLLEEVVRERKIDTLFLVNPNNPTGQTLDRADLTRIVELCQRNDLTLVMDTSFRFCLVDGFDDYSLVKDAGISFITIEDTGKIWPTLDTKASLLSYSSDIAPTLRKIYEEVYLCSSNLSLAIISTFINCTRQQGGSAFILDILRARRALVRNSIGGLPCEILNDHARAIMSVIWLDISKTGLSDLQLVKFLAARGVSVLPGRYFYWDSCAIAGHSCVRLALLKGSRQITESVARFANALRELPGLPS